MNLMDHVATVGLVVELDVAARSTLEGIGAIRADDLDLQLGEAFVHAFAVE